ncbi:Re/Si-specific NAD(P)(+) transhydrogenase subunit alpha [Taibaiella lutea]|uniref:NAD(P) transhydrogenase subunit alpha part 1 n=1 Tax=Taibaiella lutea TaxID=2608001 RepID=A0A5M6CSZ4_9BACT|nr:Re/Si-specific NAD(P)(+) transhydrogenase subunit alpha [Taibaiella lutea]KAA5537082.1 Re/Si-specific NAD(P)(+) transhydrogenase subunit alpha [Taibaiella lutea]
MLTIGVLKEPGKETRVSLNPDIAASFVKNNIKVLLEADAGAKAFHSNQQYEGAGVQIANRSEILTQNDILLSINLPDHETLNNLKPGSVIIGVFQPLFHVAKMEELAKKDITLFSLDMLPRTTRAQAMDVLSSQANIAGYKAVLLAANVFPRYFPMFMTAAGSIPPAKMLILGAGVAGLQAVATARRLGCVVDVFDTRPAVKEEVMSLGAKFVEVEGAADASKAGGYAVEQSEDFQQRQKAKIAEHAAKADVIITTAQIPGRKAPILITKEMIANMKAGSVIIDLAAFSGGNTDFTKDNETIVENGVTIIGDSALYATAPSDASKMYSKNIQNFLKLIIDKDGQLNLNFEDDLVKGACIAHEGKIVNERVAGMLQAV